jgi:hypothetical protein
MGAWRAGEGLHLTSVAAVLETPTSLETPK